MTNFQAVLLGGVQGLTEFLPISSSGHLVLVQHFMQLTERTLAFNVVVHVGTLVAVLVYFFKDIFLMTRDTFLFALKLPFRRNTDMLFRTHPYALPGCFTLLATVVTVLVAYVFKETLQSAFSHLSLVGAAWILTGSVLLLSRQFQYGDRNLFEMNHQDAFLIGLAQAFAILPGVSRSGLTILMAMFLGLQRESAAKFSFFIAIPAIIGAFVFELGDAAALFSENAGACILGFFSAAAAGFVCIFFLLKLVRGGHFFVFGYYCLAAGLLTLVYCLMQFAIS
jgi:undecaprenyl-diphosphatase